MKHALARIHETLNTLVTPSMLQSTFETLQYRRLVIIIIIIIMHRMTSSFFAALVQQCSVELRLGQTVLPCQPSAAKFLVSRRGFLGELRADGA